MGLIKLLWEDTVKEQLLRKLGRIEQLAGARPIQLRAGKSEGVKAWEVYTGSGLEFCVMEDKCLDLLFMKYKGVNLSFLAKPGPVAPSYFNVHGMEFGRYFHGGMLYTCGLGNIGESCVEGETEYNWHGRISQTPAENFKVQKEWRGERYIISLSVEMHEAAHSHEHLVLKRKISTHLGAKKLWIHDTVENLGFTREAIMLLYHMNFGYPLLNKNSRILTPLSEVELYANATGTTADSFWHSGNPVDGGLCDTFFHRLAVDKDKFTSVALINDSLSLGVYLRYSIVEFPMLVEWRNLVSGDYSVALEPCTQYPLNRLSEKAKKDMVFLNPLKSRKYRIEMGILEGKKEIEQFEEQISEYQLP